ncbi:MAG: citrate lyase holo-[acyl-carrier protein] synthase [Saezia sp.]
MMPQTHHIEQQTDFTQGEVVTLPQMLQARDERARRQQRLIEQWDRPVVSLTLVIPGKVKKSKGAETLFHAALQAFEACCQEQGWRVLECTTIDHMTGYEAQWVASTDDGKALKQQLLLLEENHPLGRLWDFDVITQQGSISRQDFDIPPRRCLVCDNVAHACARAQNHTEEELYGAMAQLVKAYA